MWHLWRSFGEDPNWQFAIEEACLRDSKDSYFFLWTSPPSVHIGKNQNLWSEVSARSCQSLSLSAHRRLSGGGTVYQDAGNLNFSILAPGEPALSFCHYLGWILPFFQKHGVPAVLRGKSDLVVDGKKFSGNAEYFTGGRVLHHGTLLFDADLERIRKVLTPRSQRYRDRAVASTPSETGNLKPYFPGYESIDAFAEALLSFLAAELAPAQHHPAPPAGIRESARKYLEKFRSLEWVVGNAPPYEMQREVSRNSRTWRLRLRTKRGRIEDLHLDAIGPDGPLRIPNLPATCLGEFHHPDKLFPLLDTLRNQPEHKNHFPDRETCWRLFF